MRHLAIKKITQVDNFSFSISWNDGAEILYRLSDVQKLCPCAQCKKAKDRGDGNTIPLNKDVKAKAIESVGRYALRIAFTEGCSLGIYDFNLLRAFITKPT